MKVVLHVDVHSKGQREEKGNVSGGAPDGLNITGSKEQKEKIALHPKFSVKFQRD